MDANLCLSDSVAWGLSMTHLVDLFKPSLWATHCTKLLEEGPAHLLCAHTGRQMPCSSLCQKQAQRGEVTCPRHTASGRAKIQV